MSSVKAKLFGSSKKQSDSQSGYQSPVPGHRVPSPNFQQPLQAFSGSASQSALERSPSLRQGQTPSIPQPPVDVAKSVNAGGNIQSGQTVDQRVLENRNSAYLNTGKGPLVSPQPALEKEPKRGFRDKLGFGHSNKQSVDSGSHIGLGRTASKRQKESQHPQSQNPEKYYTQGQVDTRSPYQRANSSTNILNTHAEVDEDSQTYTQSARRYQGAPVVPSKDEDYEPTYPQQPDPPQAYYQDSRVRPRVQTDHTAQLHGSIELLNPAEHHQQYQQDSTTHPQDQYHAYQPEEGGAPVTPYQLGPEERYSYSQQPPSYGQHARQISGQAQQPELHYPQPGPVRVSLERYKPILQPKHPSPQSGTSDPNSLFLTAPRGSSLENPPSPLIATGPAPLSQHSETHLPPSPRPGTTDSAQSSLDSMPPSGNQARGNTVRSVGDKTTGSRESSGMQLPPPPPPHKQGVQAFGSNIVPAGSQGRPFGGQAATTTQDSGRESPAPRAQQALAELVDEEAAGYMQLQKEYKELREKYQKVKKYYFEKESQVHQLQNTLAHQRLSASRTSLDDSEYAARFSRLDGLISQLAFSIRKSWRAIPDFLHHGVNKDAMATGKQEMTAVGKAYMSHWLVANLFDMYFHPSLELGLSRDLKEVSINVRRHCPPFQSGEEEEALTAKLVNWRLTTVDGLQERLRAPEAAQHHARLVEMLNEKMVGDICLLLSDPAPPDLTGGISMIIELAVMVAQHIPMESRDVAVEYYCPGSPILPDMMKLETGIPALTNPILATEASPSSVGDAAERASLKSVDTRESTTDPRDSLEATSEKKARGMFGGLMSSTGPKTTKSAPAPPQPAVAKRSETPNKEEKVRMSVGLSVQIRGRAVLAKASVYGISI